MHNKDFQIESNSAERNHRSVRRLRQQRAARGLGAQRHLI